MAALSKTKKTIKRKLYLQVSPYSVSIEFQPNVVSLPTSPLQAVSLRMSRGSRTTESLLAKLQEEPSGSKVYKAKWTGSSLHLNVSLSQDRVSGKYVNIEVTFQLRAASEENFKHECLGSCTFDLSRLNLCALDSVSPSSETRKVSLDVGNAVAAIQAITLEAAFHYEFLRDDFDISVEQSRSRETSPCARSTSPINSSSPILNRPSEAESSMMITHIKQPDNNAKQEIFGEHEQQNCQNISSQNGEDLTHEDSGGSAEILPEQSGRPPKPPKRKFKWFKKVKGLSKHNPAKQDRSEVVQPSSNIGLSNDHSKMNASVELASAKIGVAMQRDEIDTGINPVRDSEVLHVKDTNPPPKPKRSPNRHKLAKTIINPEPSKGRNGDLCHQSVQLHKESSHQPHISESKVLPFQHKRLSASVCSDVDCSTPHNRTHSYSAPLTMDKSQLHNTGSDMMDHAVRKKRSVESSVVPKRYHSRSNTHSFPSLPVAPSTRSLLSHMSGSTPHLPPARLINEQRSSSISHLAYRDRSSPKRSITDLIKPTAFSNQLRSSEGHVDGNSRPTPDWPLGILKVRLKALDTCDDFQRHMVTKANSLAAELQVESNEQPKEGLHCVFTISGSNGKFSSSVKPLLPHRTTTWNDEEVLFYAKPQSKKLFVLCHRSNLEFTTSVDTAEKKLSGKSKTKNDGCIGAASLEISSVTICSSPPTVSIYDYLSQVQCKDYKLPVQPKGSMLLQSCLCVLQPRFRVSCTGTLTIQTLSGLNCNPNHELSCTVKIDSEFQDDTNPQLVEQCVHNGWTNEPVEFNACSSYDCSIQIWAYSSEETEYWCGGCIVPLAMLLPDEEIRRCTARGDTATKCALSTHVDKIITLPIEPKGVIQLAFSLVPDCSSGQQASDNPPGEENTITLSDKSPNPEITSGPSSAVGQQQLLHIPSVHRSNRCSLRRTTRRKAGNFQLNVLKSYSEGPFCHEDQTTDIDRQTADLKREVEFLREELRHTKARLAESEFYREQAQLEIKTLREKAASTKKEDSKKTPKNNQRK